MKMKKIVVICLGIVLAIMAANPDCWAVVKDFDGDTDFDFLTGTNWNDGLGLDDDTLPGILDEAMINNGFIGASAVTYSTAITHTVGRLTVGGDWVYPDPPHTGDFGTDGELVMTAGKIIVDNRLEIARARSVVLDGDLTGTGKITMTNSELEFGNFDAIIGTRDHGELNIGLNAKVYNEVGQDTYWRIGNYGPSIDAGLEGDGLLNVYDNGTFDAHVIFVADQDSTGELRISDTARVELTGALEVRPGAPFVPGGSAKIQMNGSSATLIANNIEAAHDPGGNRSLWEFNADGGGVSAITAADSVNITDNDLVVNLNGFPLAIGETLLLFDAAPDRLFGEFASSIVNDGLIEGEVPHVMIYDQVSGDILVRAIPEPSALILLALGMVSLISAKRRKMQ